MYINNQKKKVKIPKKAIVFFVAILVVVAVLITGLVMVLTRGKEIEDTLQPMPFSSTDSYFGVGNTIVYSQGDLLTCIDTKFNTLWQLRLFSAGLDFTTGDDIIAATGDGVIQVIGTNGEHLFSTQMNGIISSAKVGRDKVAVAVDQSVADGTKSYIIIFDLAGDSLYQIDISNMNVLNYGFDNISGQLYILELDVSGAAPISRISTYRPETQSITGVKELKDQLVDNVYIIGDAVYAAGTNRLTMYKSLGASEREIMVYGWVLEDVYIADEPRFVYVPGTSSTYIDTVRILKTTGSEITINLPPKVVRVFHTKEKVYCFATNNLFVYTSEGKYLRTHSLPISIEHLQRAIEGYVFITEGETVYLMPLP